MAHENPNSLLLGLDIGSVALKAVLLDASGRLLASSHVTPQAGLAAALHEALAPLSAHAPDCRVRVGVTGQGRGSVESADCALENEILCLLSAISPMPLPPALGDRNRRPHRALGVA